MRLLLAKALVGPVAVLHLYFLALEMFPWTKPIGLETFRDTPENVVFGAGLLAASGMTSGAWRLLREASKLPAERNA